MIAASSTETEAAMTHLSAVPRKIASRAAAAAMAVTLALAAMPAAADPPGHRGHHGHGHKDWGNDRGERWHGWKERHYRRPVVRGRTIYVPAKRTRYYRNIIVVRPYGLWYPGYAYYRSD